MIVQLIFLIFVSKNSAEYFGISLGSLTNNTSLISGIFGNVWLANSTVIQITNFKIESYQKQEIIFAFISDDAVEPVKFLYKISNGNNGGDEMLIPMKRRLDGGVSEHRLIAIAPHGSTIDQWKRFGLVTGKSKKQISTVQLDKPIPQKFCCIKNVEKPEQGIIGDHYNAGTGPILIEDSKTIVIQKFSLEANKAPDAWIFAGKGDVRQTTGKKALVLGRDSLNKHCSLRDYYSGNDDLRVRLAPGQDIYQLDYISLFCYQYDVDFGHVSFKLDSKENPVPAYIPELSTTLTSKGGNDPELLENNDLEGTC